MAQALTRRRAARNLVCLLPCDLTIDRSQSLRERLRRWSDTHLRHCPLRRPVPAAGVGSQRWRLASFLQICERYAPVFWSLDAWIKWTVTCPAAAIMLLSSSSKPACLLKTTMKTCTLLPGFLDATWKTSLRVLAIVVVGRLQRFPFRKQATSSCRASFRPPTGSVDGVRILGEGIYRVSLNLLLPK